MSDSLQPHGLQHTRLPCPSPTPRACSNSCPRVSDAIQPFHPLSSPSPAFNLFQHQGLFQWVSSSYQVAKVLEFQLQHQSFQWIFKAESFRIDWFDLLAVQGTLKSLLQHHSSKASILWHSAFFMESLLMKVKKESEKAGLKLNIQKTKIMTSSPITSWQINGGKNGNTEQTLFSWASKSLLMVIAAKKLKDTCSLEEKVWST